MRRWTAVAVSLLAGLCALAGCQGPTGRAQANEEKSEKDRRLEAALPVEVVAVETASVSAYLMATTNLEAKSEARVLAESEGIVRDMLAEEGADVKRGQVLARLDDREARVQWTRAKAKADNDAAAYRRAESLVKRGLMATDEFERVGLARQLSEAELLAAELVVSQKEILAPFEGRVTLRACRLGERVIPTQHLFTVADFDPLVAIVHLPERQVARLQVGSAVELFASAPEAAGTAASVTAQVDQVSPVVDPKTGTVKVTLAVPRPPAGLRPGSFVRIRLVQDVHPAALVVPKEAVVRDLAENFVYVLDPDPSGDRVDKRRVDLGLTEGDVVEVTRGLQSDDLVVAVGQGGLRPRSLVKVVRERPARDVPARG